MHDYILIGIASIVVLGVASQWLAWRLQLPAVLLLLITGLIAGPITGFIVPDVLFGDILVPVVSLSVALILFEGGMTLKLKELKAIGDVVRRLISIGLLATWVISTIAAYYIFGFSLRLSAVIGAILVVTGPTVIGPLLMHVRPSKRVSSVLRWEGILIDPVGATFALLVFQAVVAVDMHAATLNALPDFISTMLIGASVGILGAIFLVLMLHKFLVPDYLQNAVAFMLVIAVYASSNVVQAESGLLATTVMGIAIANQNFVAVKRITEFKETLQVLLISALFITLTARLELPELSSLLTQGACFLAVLIFIVRPLSVFISARRSGLNFKEKILISFIAPRGIVAVAVSAVFALSMEQHHFPQAEQLVPATFLVVIGTVVFYSLIAYPLARWLNLSQPNPQGLLIVGAHSWAREMAYVLKEEGQQVLLVDTNNSNVNIALSRGIPAHHGNILADFQEDNLDLSGMGRLLALTGNNEVNSLASLWYADHFGTSEVYQLPYQTDDIPKHLHGRFVFGKKANYKFINDQFIAGSKIQVIDIKKTDSYAELNSIYGESFLPLFIIDENKKLAFVTLENPPIIREGQRMIFMA